MSGRELENRLTLIDRNIESTQRRVWSEVMTYLNDHEDEAVSQLRLTRTVTVPTSVGPRSVSLAELESLAH
jgi:hypothetical protein